MSAELINIRNDVVDPNYRYKMPRVISRTVGRGKGIKTSIDNVGDIAKALVTEPSYIAQFLGIDRASRAKYDPKSRFLIINGEHSNEDLQQSIYNFINKYILCEKCRYPELALTVENGEVRTKCQGCGHEKVWDPTDKLIVYIKKHPPKRSVKSTIDAVGVEEEEEEQKQDDNEIVEIEMAALRKLIKMKDPKPSTLAARLKKICRKHKWNRTTRTLMACDLYFQGLDGRGILRALDERKEFFQLIVTTPKSRRAFIGYFERLCGMEQPDELGKYILPIYKKIYENDIVVDDATFFSWYRSETSVFCPDKQRLDQLKEYASRFIQWLEEAEEEESESSEFDSEEESE